MIKQWPTWVLPANQWISYIQYILIYIYIYIAYHELHRYMIYNTIYIYICYIFIVVLLFVYVCPMFLALFINAHQLNPFPAAVSADFARYVKNAEKTQERLQHAIELMNLGGDDGIHDQLIRGVRRWKLFLLTIVVGTLTLCVCIDISSLSGIYIIIYNIH